MKRWRIRSWKIKQRVLALAILPIIGLTLIIGYYMTTLQLNAVDQSLQTKGQFILQHLATTSEFGLFSKNIILLQTLADATLKDPDIISVKILDSGGTHLAFSQKKSNEKTSGVEINNPQTLHFTEPVFSTGIKIFEEEEKNSPMLLGSIAITLSKKQILKQQKQILRNSLFFLSLGLLVSIILAMRIGRSIVQPILRLTDIVKQIQKNKFNVRISTISGGELGTLESGINKMIATIESAKQALEIEVNQATDALRNTVKKLEQKNRELDQANHEAILAGKSKAIFFATMSHEIRTPVNAIIGFTNLLKRQNTEELRLEYISIIDQSAVHLLSIIDDILNFSHLDSGNIELENIEYDIRQCCDDVATMNSSSAHKKELELALLVNTDVPDLTVGDPTRFKQILSNLIGNALKFTNKGSVVVHVKMLDSMLHCSVKDTGVGLDQTKISEIFEVFSQQDKSINRRFGGTGLGLPIVKKLVELMGGKLGVKSEGENGTEFWFELPLTSGIEVSYEKCDSHILDSINILLYEPHAITRRAIRNNILKWGADIFVATNKTRLIEIMHSTSASPNFNLIILGFEPGSSSEEIKSLIIQLRHHFSIPILCLLNVEPRNIYLFDIDLDNFMATSKPISNHLMRTHILELLHRRDRINLDCPPKLTEKPDYPLRDKKILVAEDQQFNQTLLHTLLKTLGAKVDIAKDGLSALQSARTLDYDYIFMDIHMPKMDGIECTDKIRKLSNHKTTAIIALTADVFFADQAVLKEMGFNACLYKPISEKKLRQICITYLNIKLSTTENFEKDSSPNRNSLAHIPSQLHFRLIEALLKQIEVTKSALHNETLFYTEMHKLKGLIDTFNLDTVKKHYEALLTQQKADNHKAMLHTFKSIKTIVLSYAKH